MTAYKFIETHEGCRHNGSVVITGKGRGGCIVCHKKVVSVSKLEIEHGFIPSVYMPQRHWVTAAPKGNVNLGRVQAGDDIDEYGGP